MKRAGVFRAVAISASLVGAGMFCRAATGEVVGGGGVKDPTSDDVIVTGVRPGELRNKVKIAEGAVFNRFNEINGNRKFDIHCFSAKEPGSRIAHRYCESNSWRDLNAKIGEALARQLRGDFSGPLPEQFLAEQAFDQAALSKEARRLVVDDKEFREALMNWWKAKEAIEPMDGRLTRAYEVMPGANGLPYGAKHVFQVLVGGETWGHALTQRTFSIAGVSGGGIRKMRLKCDDGSQRLEFKEGVEWTSPAKWGDCSLLVDAKRDTTFTFFEFE